MTQGRKFLESLKNFVMLKDIKSTLQWVRPRLNVHYDQKNILYCYLEDYGNKCIHKSPQFAITSYSRKQFLKDSKPKVVKKSDILSTLYSKPLRGFRKPKFKNGDRVHFSKYDLPFRKNYEPQYAPDVFEFVAISSTKPPTNTKKDEQDKNIRDKFDRIELIKVI